jgi:tripartite-type tricarboxylate transporter receptor subunit TctC
MRSHRATIPAAVALLACTVNLASAESAADFYRGKQLRLIVGHPVGADYDIGARLLAKYLAPHIPGHPSIIVQNMPGAGSIIAANYFASQAPRDGTVFGSFSRNFPSQALMGQSRIKADPRSYNYLGATSLPSRVCVTWHAARAKTLADVFEHELIVGSSAGSSLSIIPTVLNHVLSTKFRIVEGYKGPPDVLIAMERGEVEGMCSSYAQFRAQENLIRQGKMRILLRAEEIEVPELAQVPSVYDYAKTDDQRRFMRFVFSSTEFGRPYVMPPDVPPERVAAMRKAMADAVHDPELVAEATRMKLDMSYTAPEQLEQLLARLYETPPAMIEAVKKLVPGGL